MKLEYLSSEAEVLKSLLKDKTLTAGEELAIQHIVAKMRELNTYLLEKEANNVRDKH